MAKGSILAAENALEVDYAPVRVLSSERAVLFSDETTSSVAGHSSSQAIPGPFWRHERCVAADGAGWHDAPMHRHGPDVARLILIGRTWPLSRHVAAT